MMLVIAIIFNYSIHGRVARGTYSAAVGRSVAVVSLFLWVTIVFSGIFYSFS